MSVSSEYGCLAPYYDLFNDRRESGEKESFCFKAFERFASRPVSSVLDLACGTGDMSVLLCDRGMDVVGVDLSEQMLSVAKKKAGERKILFLRQDMSSLDLYGTVDAALCLSDSLNCLPSGEAIRRTLERVSLFLEEDGLFLFDVSTPFRLKEVLDGRDIVLEEEGVLLTWSNDFNENTNTLRMRYDVFSEEENGLYRRESEVQKTKAYRLASWKKWIASAGLETAGVFSSPFFDPVGPGNEKWFFVTKKASSAHSSLPN